MSYLEMQQEFYRTMPILGLKLFIALVLFYALYMLLSNKRVVRILCRFILLIPVVIVAVILHIAKY